MKGKSLLILALAAVLSAPLAAQSVTVDDLSCVPMENHGVVSATVSPDQAGTEMRLYFRRLHKEVEDFYYSVMRPSGGGNYWGVMPDPEDHGVEKTEGSFWKAKEASQDRNPDGDLDMDVIRERAQAGAQESRDWLNTMTDSELDAWLRDQKSEPVEYFAALYNVNGDRIAKSDMKIASVRGDCRAQLDSAQTGESLNQTVGETATWQANLALFHWECDNLVTRIDYSGVKQADSICRACVVAVIPFWIPATAAAAALAGVVSCASETGTCEEDGSPSEP